MAILKIKECPTCGRNSKLTERNGGWTVDCCMYNPIAATLDNVTWCDECVQGDAVFDIFDSPNEAIHAWNSLPRKKKKKEGNNGKCKI